MRSLNSTAQLENSLPLKTPATFCGPLEKRQAFCRVPFSESLPPDLVALGENNKVKGKGAYLSPSVIYY